MLLRKDCGDWRDERSGHQAGLAVRKGVSPARQRGRGAGRAGRDATTAEVRAAVRFKSLIAGIVVHAHLPLHTDPATVKRLLFCY